MTASLAASALIVGLMLPLNGCTTASSSPPSATPAPRQLELSGPSVGDASPREYPGLHNVVAYHVGFYSGAAPEGAEAFASLRAMGVKTILSVDGAEPDVAAAKAQGLRYIHLPIGYNGFDEQRKLQLVRATRDAITDGGVYLHCHHGKHRSAGAAAAVAASLGWLTPEQGVARMKVSGTAPNYKGLYQCAADANVLGAEVVDAVPTNFPEVWRPETFVRSMVEADNVLEQLKVIEKAGWKPPSDHPDLVPVAEAGRLAEHLRQMLLMKRTTREPKAFAEGLAASHAKAQLLEDALAATAPDAEVASARFKLVVASCKDCHAQFRDVAMNH